jgi:hypothetical protein
MRWLALLALLFSTPLFAANPADELLARVPTEATVHIVVHDVQKHWKSIQASPFAGWFIKSDFGLNIKNEPTIKQLLAAEKALPELLRLSSKQLFEEAVGPAVVLAYVPASSGEAVVFLTKSPKPATTMEFWKNLNTAQTKAGEITKLVPGNIGEVNYTERQKPDGRADYFAILDDGLFVYTASKPVLETVLKRSAKSEAPVLTRLTQLSSKSEATRLLTVLMDPKSIDKQLVVDEQATTKDEEKAFLQQFRKLVGPMKSVGFTLDVERDAEIALRVCFDRPALPAEFAPLLKPDRKVSALWAGIPSTSLLSLSGRMEPDAVLPLLMSFMTKDSREQFEKMQREVLGPVVGKTTLVNAASGMDWAVWLHPGTKADQWPALAAAIRFHTAKSNSLDGALAGCDFVAQLIRVQYNKAFDGSLKIEEHNSGDFTYKTINAKNLLPDGVEPTYGLKGDLLVVSSHPSAWLSFDPKGSKTEPASLIARLNTAGLVKELKQNGKAYAGLLALLNGATAEANEQALPALIGTLELFDKIELHQSVSGDVVSVSLKAQMVKPLK